LKRNVGDLTVGHAQTFWIAQNRAKTFDGQLYLRIEDIDVTRCKPHFFEDLVEDLRWFGIDFWDKKR